MRTVCMGEMWNSHRCWLENLKEKDHLKMERYYGNRSKKGLLLDKTLFDGISQLINNAYKWGVIKCLSCAIRRIPQSRKWLRTTSCSIYSTIIFFPTKAYLQGQRGAWRSIPWSNVSRINPWQSHTSWHTATVCSSCHCYAGLEPAQKKYMSSH